MYAWRSNGVLRICVAVVCLFATAAVRGQQAGQPAPTEQTQRLEGEAILALADAALDGKSVPHDFTLGWQHEYLKAQHGTFLPFTLTIDPSQLARPAVLIYIRAVRRERSRARRERMRGNPLRSQEQDRREVPGEYPVDAIFPAELRVHAGQARISRGFALPPGDYDLIVVVRERVGPAGPEGTPRAAVLARELEVPDLTEGLTTSSIILADGLEILERPIEPDELPERPYVIGRHAVTPAADRMFRKSEELLVLFLVYNPFVTTEKNFDLQVEYHFFRRGVGSAGGRRAGGDAPPEQEGERYFNHTDPQRFNPRVLGPQFDPAAGNPVMAGQGVPLAGFETGDYRLAIRVTDLLAGKSIVRDVHFTVGS